MKHKYSLVHLSDISCPPPQFIYAAAEAGYDCVSLRTIPMGLKGEVPHDIAADRQLFQDTKKALADTGIYINDTENARIYDGVEISAYEPAIAAIAVPAAVAAVVAAVPAAAAVIAADKA